MVPLRCLASVLVPCLLGVACRADEVPFALQVTPTLYKLGCSAGACHGSFGGKGHFRLSLFAADPEADHRAVRYEGAGRRVDPLSPSQSLLLLKATGAVPHGGGVRLARAGPEYRLLHSWIGSGMRYDAGAEGAVVSVRAEPASFSLDARTPARPLRVLARLSGGREQDVTRWASFESLDPRVAPVDAAGVVRRARPGDTPVLARYAGSVAFATVTIPGEVPPGLRFPAEELPDKVDRLLVDKLRRLNVVPSPRCDDAEFLRRVHLDVTGTLPLPGQVRRFLADRDAGKRAKCVDRLLASPEHASVWALKVLDLVGADDRFGAPVYAWFDRLRAGFARNDPWDRIASLDYVAGLKFNQGNDGMQTLDARKVALQAAYAYLGVHLECAQCHKHPQDRWTQNDFFALAQAFAYVDPRNTRAWPVEVFRDAVTGRPLGPKLLGGPAIEMKPGASPRREVWRWMTAKENPYFAKAMVNRVWAHYFGRGLLEPVDAQAAANPPAHPELLDELARDFIAGGYDLRRLHRRILNTAAYQRSWRTNVTSAFDDRNFSHRLLRLLTAEQVVDAVNQATGAPLQVSLPYAKLPAKRVVRRAGELPPSRYAPTGDGYLLQIFGKPLRTQASDYERGSAASVSQVLYLYNSQQLRDKIAAPGGRLRRLLARIADDRELIEELYLLTLTRPATADEAGRMLALLKGARSREGRAAELLWSLFNHKEFLINK